MPWSTLKTLPIPFIGPLSPKGIGELLSIFGLFTFMFPSLSGWKQRQAVAVQLSAFILAWDGPKSVCLLIVGFHMLLSGDLGRMGYLAAPVFCAALASVFTHWRACSARPGATSGPLPNPPAPAPTATATPAPETAPPPAARSAAPHRTKCPPPPSARAAAHGPPFLSRRNPRTANASRAKFANSNHPNSASTPIGKPRQRLPQPAVPAPAPASPPPAAAATPETG